MRQEKKKTHKISKAEVRRRKKESSAYDAKSWQDLKKKKDKSIEKNKGSVVKCGHLHWKIYEGIKTLRLQKPWNQDYSSMRGIASPYVRYCS